MGACLSSGIHETSPETTLVNNMETLGLGNWSANDVKAAFFKCDSWDKFDTGFERLSPAPAKTKDDSKDYDAFVELRTRFKAALSGGDGDAMNNWYTFAFGVHCGDW